MAEVGVSPTQQIAAQTLHLSELAPGAVQSEIRAMSVLAEEAGAINLAQGICDTAVPAIVAEGAARAIESGHNIYTRLDGFPRLRRAIARKVEQTLGSGTTVDSDREVVVTAGATGALFATLMALLNPGDEAILFEPLYGYHASSLKAVRAVPVVLPFAVDSDSGRWLLDLDAVRAAVTPRTRAIIINTPANPCGKVFTRAELEGLAAIALEHNLFVISDEIYEHFVYGEARHISIASIPGMRDRTILISGFSKTFSITGWRVGYLVADARWTPSIGYFHDLLYICAPAPFQHAVADGLEQLEPDFYRGLPREHETKSAMLLSALRDADLPPHAPDGAYYILADVCRIPGATAAERARTLLRQAGVAAVAGSAFFRPGGGEDLLRFCFAKRDMELAEACRRLRNL